jgi:hypothetical protein
VASGLLPLEQQSLDDYRWLRRVGLRLRLLREEPQEVLRASERSALARSLDLPEDALTRGVAEAMARTRARFAAVLGTPQSS